MQGWKGIGARIAQRARVGMAGLLLWAGLATAASPMLPMWEVRVAAPNGATVATVYLLGSVHVCRASCYPLAPSVLNRFDAATVLAVELDPRRPELQEKLMAVAMLPGEQRVQDLLSANDRQLFDAVLPQLGLQPEAMARFQPWMTAMLVSLVAAQQAGYGVELGVDQWAINRADKQRKRILELETIDRQITALTAGTMEEHIAGLRQALQMVRDRRMASYMDALVNAWRQGDAEGLDRLMDEGMPAGGNWREELLGKRNREMARAVEGFLARRERAVVVVGAAHLAGPGSLPDLLMRAGYQVRQLKAGD